MNKYIKFTAEQRRKLCREIEEEIINGEDLGRDYRDITENIVSIVCGERVSYFCVTDADDVTNLIMDRLRDYLKMDADSDKDDEIYTIVHSTLTKFFGIN